MSESEDPGAWKGSTKLEAFPLAGALKGYTFSKARADLKAAVNVALLDFPQGMAYALLAGLPVQFGIFCSSLASVVGPFFASSRFVMLGPTNATAVMLLSAFLTLGYSPAQAATAMPILLLMVAVFMVAGAFFRVASLTSYISRSVVVGYITAAACLIVVNQLKTALGMDVARAGTFVESAANIFAGWETLEWTSTVVSLLTLGIYLVLRRWASRLPVVALTLVIAAVVCAGLRSWGGFEYPTLEPVRITGWPLSLPVFDWTDFNALANAALAIAFLSLLESSSIAKTLAAQAGDRIDLNQQMLGMGAASFACAFGSGMAVSGSLTRSILNYRSGARSPLSSIFSGLMLALGVVFFGEWIGYIPKPSLAVLVILVGISLINPRQIMTMAKTTKSDAVVLFGTLIGGLLLPLDTAIYLGAVLSIALFVRKAAHPELREIAFDESGNLVERDRQRTRPEIAIVHVEGDLFFASSDIFLEQMRHLVAHPAQRIIILRLRNAHHLDATAAQTIGDLIRFARSQGREILVSGARPGIQKVFVRSGLMELLGSDNFFSYSEGNPNVSTRQALKRAQVLTGIESADITIFAAEKS